ncbi:MAG: hypothetical protein C4575_08875 [Desulforudis sp.]|nr:MAG: hypothetical protein C4575_08875 [Desulforudis sp.]
MCVDRLPFRAAADDRLGAPARTRWATLTVWFVLSLLLLFPCAGSASAAPRVLLDGKPRSFDVPPVMEQGRVLVPMRAIFQALGAELEWDGATETVTATRGRTTVILTIGSRTVFKNGSPVVLDVPAKIINGRTVVPLRFVSEALGAGVDWDAVAQTVTISSGTPPAEGSQGVAPKPETSLIKREFAWDYGGKRWTWKLLVPEATYTYYTNLKRPPTDDYSVYVTDPADDTFISSLAARLKETAVREKYSPKQTVELVVTFVQNIKYALDNVSKGVEEYPRYPLETLVDQEGDCEDHSILLASVLKEMDYGVILIYFPGEHMAVGVKGKDLPGAYYEYEGARYYYVETTATGWSIGKIPDEYLRTKARIVPLVPRPVLTHKGEYKWTSKGTAGGWLELKVEVRNDGTATARATKVYAALDAGGGLVYDQQWSDSLDLEPHSAGTYTLFLKLPANVYTRLIVKIVSDGHLADESTSDWFNA